MLLTADHIDGVSQDHLKLKDLALRVRAEVAAAQADELQALLQRSVLDLRRQADLIFDMQERGAFLDPVVEHRPTQSAAVEGLRRQRARLISELDAVTTMGEEAAAARRERLLVLLDKMVAHTDRVHELVQSTFNVELGYPS